MRNRWSAVLHSGDTLRRRGGLTFAALLGLCGPTLACTLDFDRYSSGDGSADGAPPPADAAPPPPDTSIDGPVDSGTVPPADAPVADGPCSLPPACLTAAMTCAATCKQHQQQCVTGCMDATPCEQMCTETEQSCAGKCVSTCLACGADAGCSSQTECLNSGTP